MHFSVTSNIYFFFALQLIKLFSSLRDISCTSSAFFFTFWKNFEPVIGSRVTGRAGLVHWSTRNSLFIFFLFFRFAQNSFFLVFSWNISRLVTGSSSANDQLSEAAIFNWSKKTHKRSFFPLASSCIPRCQRVCCGYSFERVCSCSTSLLFLTVFFLLLLIYILFPFSYFQLRYAVCVSSFTLLSPTLLMCEAPNVWRCIEICWEWIKLFFYSTLHHNFWSVLAEALRLFFIHIIVKSQPTVSAESTAYNELKPDDNFIKLISCTHSRWWSTWKYDVDGKSSEI